MSDFLINKKGIMLVPSLITGYLIARKLGTQMGMDFGLSNDDYAIYIVFGTAWLR